MSLVQVINHLSAETELLFVFSKNCKATLVPGMHYAGDYTHSMVGFAECVCARVCKLSACPSHVDTNASYICLLTYATVSGPVCYAFVLCVI